MNNKLTTGVALLALAVALGVGFLKPNLDLQSVNVQPLVDAIEKATDKFGAVVGPDSYFPYVGNNNVRVYTVKGSVVSSTTPCTLEVPLYNTASTTLEYVGWRVLSAPTTTSEVRIFTSLSRNATTTFLSGVSLATTATGTLVSATTSLTTDDAVMAAGDRYITFSVFSSDGESKPYIAVGNAVFCAGQFKVVQ